MIRRTILIYTFSLLLNFFLLGKEQVFLETEEFSLTLSADGFPKSLVLKGDGRDRELLNQKTPGEGFYLEIAGHDKKIILSDLTYDKEKGLMTARPEIKGKSNLTPLVVFEIKQHPKYIAFHLKKTEGIPSNANIALKFALNTNTSNFRAFDFNYMTTTKEQRAKNVQVEWPCLWQYEEDYGYGGFAVYYFNSEDEEDDIITHIWAEQGLAHPKIDGEWTYERAKKWIDEYYQALKNRSRYGGWYGTLAAEAETLEELYTLADYAEKGGFPGVYLMPWIWRGEYWTRKKSTVEVNTNIFPRGEDDLKKYSNYLSEKGLALDLHYVSGGIGLNDREYVAGASGPDSRLATWGEGTLEKAIGTKDKTLYFRPAEGTERPSQLFRPGITRIPLLDHNTQYNVISIGKELIKVGEFEDTDKPVWKLTGCVRGHRDSAISQHSSEAGVRGYLLGYGQVFLPDQKTTLFSDIAKSYAQFMNRCNIAHAVFDGLEIHNNNGFQQGEKFAEIVYKELGHPTLSHTSGGRQAKAWIETRLNRREKEWGDGEGNYAVLLTDSPSRIATTPRHAHFMLSHSAAFGVVGMGFAADDRGVSVQSLAAHGKTDEILQAVKTWRQVVPYLNPEQKEKLRAERYIGRHPYSKIYHEISSKTDGWMIYPVGFMEQDNYDGYWNTAQEHGAMAPKQFIKANQEIKLNNPFKEQVPEVVIRVLSATNRENPENIDLMPLKKNLKNSTDSRIIIEGKTLSLSHNHKKNESYESINLATWKKPINMISHRVLGMWVEGDKSGALLVASPGKKRYYASLIDFNGRRYIEIPHGEAYFAQEMLASPTKSNSDILSCAKFFNYNRVQNFQLGLSRIPSNTKVDIKISELQALKEIPTQLVNPVINIGSSSLKVLGTVNTSEYLEYLGGDYATVYDANWNEINKLKVEATEFKAKQGKQNVSISSKSENANNPWLELQLFVKDQPIKVRKNK